MSFIDLDKWQEIFSMLRRNRLRTLMTAFGVFWGIFILVILLAFGVALESGAKKTMPDFASSQLYVWGGRTTLPFQGMQPGRNIGFDLGDHATIEALPGVEHVAPRISLGGYRSANNVSRGAKTGAFTVMGDFPQWHAIQPFEFYEGRFINDFDIRDRRKVVVLGEQAYEMLFEPGESVIGKSLLIRGVYFRVVGRVHSTRSGGAADRDAATVYIPFTTFQRSFNQGDRVGWFAMTAAKGYSSSALHTAIKDSLKARKKVHPADTQAIQGYNAAEKAEQASNLFGGIRLFMWFVGLATLFAGVLGVSNIMVIVVRERTKEIGVRKALGATPRSIITLVLQESVTLTVMAGYLGLVAAVGLTEFVGNMLEGTDIPLGRPEVDFAVAVSATIVLVIAGAIAGFIPARQAAAVHPVKALRAE